MGKDVNPNLAKYQALVKKHAKILEAMKDLPDGPAKTLLRESASYWKPPKLSSLTPPLYDADEACDHKSDPWNASGVRCLYCSAWFCY
jgi:ABC-type nitrate/sulfonate/bicarbonate transport system substrate-binding protein